MKIIKTYDGEIAVKKNGIKAQKEFHILSRILVIKTYWE